jgi:hypothetical protein
VLGAASPVASMAIESFSSEAPGEHHFQLSYSFNYLPLFFSPTHPEGRDNIPLNVLMGDEEDEIYLAHNLSRLQDHNDLHVLDFSKNDTNLT